jgi:hypothetical protein
LMAIGFSADRLAHGNLDAGLWPASDRIRRGVERLTEMRQNLTDHARA